MWVVKLPGGLAQHALLPDWLALLARLGGGRVTVVCGAGPFAGPVRQARMAWQLADACTRPMAVLAMAQCAYQAHGLQPALQLASDHADIQRVLRAGQAALWLPPLPPLAPALPAAGDDGPGCSESLSDRLALDLAIGLNAERLVLVTARAVPAAGGAAWPPGPADADDPADAAALALAQRAACPVSLVHLADLDRMRRLLLGGGRPGFRAGHPA